MNPLLHCDAIKMIVQTRNIIMKSNSPKVLKYLLLSALSAFIVWWGCVTIGPIGDFLAVNTFCAALTQTFTVDWSGLDLQASYISLFAAATDMTTAFKKTFYRKDTIFPQKGPYNNFSTKGPSCQLVCCAASCENLCSNCIMLRR